MELNYRIDKPFLMPIHTEEIIRRKQEVFDRLTKDIPTELGNEVSKKDRDEMQANQMTLTYGEISFYSFAEIFETVKDRYGGFQESGVFYDLGAGTGKGILAAALLHNFSVCKGIELLPGLCEISASVKELWQAEGEALGEIGVTPAQMQFEVGDIFQSDWTDADCIFANSTCFSSEMMDRISQLPVQSGAKAITFTKHLDGENWKLLERVQKDMSWGIATVFIHEYKH